ncbi:hypothetical protein [Natronocalculus amylovorans]|uniref:Uncharacterized protein n=1 Tax=Natronocalculus amylovorans TaxID=2917812 RepID=A0AAE3FW85_9EURY|nr:hypothetical protein [Natronocalculus amylovorans]MCL9816376.1 hypothetical protein [Natronocalculus amylovorans]NUE03468.1 hypothetical protein [Halorubraceae archaeon YAN]
MADRHVSSPPTESPLRHLLWSRFQQIMDLDRGWQAVILGLVIVGLQFVIQLI